MVRNPSISRNFCFSGLLGLEDGTIAVWDLRESYALHREVLRIDTNNEAVHRSPTFTSSDAEEAGHESPITGLCPIRNLESSSSTMLDANDFVQDTFQLITSEEHGKVIIWTVIEPIRDSDVHLGLAHWGCVRIVSSVQLQVPSECLSSHDVIFGHNTNEKDDRSDFFVATGNGNILHASALVGHKPSPRYYKPELDGQNVVRALSFCPFGEQFFLAGSDDGSVSCTLVLKFFAKFGNV